jgi:hypothetical protein
LSAYIEKLLETPQPETPLEKELPSTLASVYVDDATELLGVVVDDECRTPRGTQEIPVNQTAGVLITIMPSCLCSAAAVTLPVSGWRRAAAPNKAREAVTRAYITAPICQGTNSRSP